MPRPCIRRRIRFSPNARFFKPAGIRMTALEEVALRADEFEALRLKDLLGLQQEDAAVRMGISQPTFHRIVTSARRTVADALINGKAIRVHP